jgi:hypothetical protein
VLSPDRAPWEVIQPTDTVGGVLQGVDNRSGCPEKELTMPSLFTTFANFALELLFPQRCAVCGEEARSVVCQGCDPAESVLESDKLLGGVRCHSCGEPTEREGTCAQCLLFPLPMRRLASV